jgi:hypothetical protein
MASRTGASDNARAGKRIPLGGVEVLARMAFGMMLPIGAFLHCTILNSIVAKYLS